MSQQKKGKIHRNRFRQKQFDILEEIQKRIMKKKLVTLGLIMGLLLVGCGSAFLDLPDNAEGFKAGSIEDKNGDGYATIEYDGNTYVPFGTLKGTISRKDVDECIGYIIMDEEISSIPDSDNKDTRLYTLKDDPDHIFIMDYYVNGEME